MLRDPTSRPNEITECRSCNAPAVWVVHATTGSRMLVDADPVATGNLKLRRLLNGKLEASHCKLEGVPLYVAHFATCPDSARWRKKK